MALISFDLDGVLQRNPFHAGKPDGVFGHIQRELAPYLTDMASGSDILHEALGLVLREHTDRLTDGRLVPAYDWDDIVRSVGGRIGYPGRVDVEALVHTYCTDPKLVYLYPGARECLEALRASGHMLVTITNGFRIYQEPILRQLGILDLFSAEITPDEAGAVKPQPEIFRTAERKVWGDEPRHGAPCIHVGDTLTHDIAGARRAGWLSVYIVQPGAPGFSELPEGPARMAPRERPAAARAWLESRLAQDRRFYDNPPVELDECIPDAIVTSLAEVPAVVSQLAAE